MKKIILTDAISKTHNGAFINLITSEINIGDMLMIPAEFCWVDGKPSIRPQPYFYYGQQDNYVCMSSPFNIEIKTDIPVGTELYIIPAHYKI